MNFISNTGKKKECSEWIKLTEERSYVPALVNIDLREVLMTEDRCIIDDVHMTNVLYERIKSYLPGIWIVDLNEYGIYQRPDGHGETKTVQLYLNDNYKGGEITFLNYHDTKKNYSCKPRT
ncbi:unnamed protein product [Rotaria sp. Silwood2]|nr:unnamed protein product [Rotaria sp. Silwood2]